MCYYINRVKRLLAKDEAGQTMVEAVLALVLLVGILATVMFFGRLGDKLISTHFAARAAAFGVKESLVWNPPSEVKVSTAGLSGNQSTGLGIGPIAGFMDFINGTRTAEVQTKFEGKVAGSNQMLEKLEASINTSYTVDQDTWQQNPKAVAWIFWGIDLLIVLVNIGPDQIEGRNTPGLPGGLGKYKKYLPQP